MSFLSILGKIGDGIVTGAAISAPFLNLFLPGVGSVVGTVAGMIVKAEQTYQGEKQGTAKKQVVMDEFTALLPMFNQALQEHGLKMSISADAISSLIDSTVSQFNAAKTLHDTFKIEKI